MKSFKDLRENVGRGREYRVKQAVEYFVSQRHGGARAHIGYTIDNGRLMYMDFNTGEVIHMAEKKPLKGLPKYKAGDEKKNWPDNARDIDRLR